METRRDRLSYDEYLRQVKHTGILPCRGKNGNVFSQFTYLAAQVSVETCFQEYLLLSLCSEAMNTVFYLSRWRLHKSRYLHKKDFLSSSLCFEARSTIFYLSCWRLHKQKHLVRSDLYQCSWYISDFSYLHRRVVMQALFGRRMFVNKFAFIQLPNNRMFIVLWIAYSFKKIVSIYFRASSLSHKLCKLFACAM